MKEVTYFDTIAHGSELLLKVYLEAANPAFLQLYNY